MTTSKAILGAGVLHRSAHVSEAQLLPAIRECPFCAGPSFDVVGCLQREPEVSLLRCAGCSCGTASRIPTEEALEAIYRAYYQIDGIELKKQDVNLDGSARFARHLLTHIALPPKRVVRILDFGGGDGVLALEIARRLLARGAGSSVDRIDVDVVELSGVDTVTPSPGPIRLQRMRALSELDPEQTYDLVVASAIIEHLPYPRRDLTQLFNFVAGGGSFYARTPYMAPLFALLKRVGVTLDMLYPIHLHDLGDRFWNGIPALARRWTGSEFEMLRSTPSIVETGLLHHPVRTLLAKALKLPWYVVSRRHQLVGGWEVFMRRRVDAAPS